MKIMLITFLTLIIGYIINNKPYFTLYHTPDSLLLDEVHFNYMNDVVETALEEEERASQNEIFFSFKPRHNLRPLKMTANSAVFMFEPDAVRRRNTKRKYVVKRIIIDHNKYGNDDIIGKLQHENIVTCNAIIDTQINDEFEQKTDIKWIINPYLPIRITIKSIDNNEEILRSILIDVVKGLAFLHSRNIAHLDIKMGNILGVEENDKIVYKLIDFGYSRVFPSGKNPKDGKSDKEIFVERKSFGTFPYKAPEVVFDNIHGCAADIWCVGAIAWFSVIGHIPFYKGSNRVKDKKKYTKFLMGEIVPWMPSFVSFDLQDFILKCFEIDRSKRITATELLDHAFLTEDIQE